MFDSGGDKKPVSSVYDVISVSALKSAEGVGGSLNSLRCHVNLDSQREKPNPLWPEHDVGTTDFLRLGASSGPRPFPECLPLCVYIPPCFCLLCPSFLPV